MQDIPTLKQLYNQTLNDIENELGINIPTFGRNLLRAKAAVQAGRLKLLYLLVARVQTNIFADTAEPEAQGGTLERFGRVKINRDPFPAQAAKYQVQVTGTVGATIPGGTTFKSDDSSANPGQLYQLDQDFTLQTDPDDFEVRALEGGLDSKLSVGDTMTATTPIANVDDQVEVTNENTAPVSAETIEEYRDNVIRAYRLEPQGGAATDYRLWSLDAQGVRTSYPKTVPGSPNIVEVYVEANPSDSINGKGVPPSAMISDVEDVIDLDPDTTKPLLKRGRRPIDDIKDVKPITPLDVDITINNFQNLTTQLQNDIEAALEDYLSDVRPFVAGIDNLTDRRDTFSENDIIYIINTVQISTFDSVDLVVDGSTVSSFQFTNGDIPYLNSVTFN